MLPIRVWPTRRMKVRASLWMELSRLSLALAIAGVGLIAGAREQILRLDTLPALIAVFLLGFGSDRIKNMFGQGVPSPSAEVKAAPAPAEPRAPTGADARSSASGG